MDRKKNQQTYNPGVVLCLPKWLDFSCLIDIMDTPEKDSNYSNGINRIRQIFEHET